MKVKRTQLLAASLLVMLAVSGCKREATGQVVAVVNGDEITLQELNAELGAFQVPQNADTKEMQKKFLQRIIDRRLIAMAGRNDGIDKDQEYLLRRRQVDDALIGQMLGQRAERTFRIPTAAEIDKYIAAHPTVFGGRVVYDVDRIQFPMPGDPTMVRKLEGDHSMDAVAAKLKSLGLTFSRDTAKVDSASISPEMINNIRKLPPTEPFMVPQPGGVSVAVITGTTPTPLLGDQAKPVAIQMMRKDAVEQALVQRLKTEKASAKIEYQPNFSPSKSTKS